MYKDFIGKEVKVYLSTKANYTIVWVGTLKEVKENGNIILQNAKIKMGREKISILEINKDYIISVGIE